MSEVTLLPIQGPRNDDEGVAQGQPHDIDYTTQPRRPSQRRMRRVYRPDETQIAMRVLSESTSTDGSGLGDPSNSLLSDETWKLYLDMATKQDEEQYKVWNGDLDMILLFSALFSAVLTTFIVEVYPTLLPDPVTIDTLLLQQIVSTLQSNASAGSSIVNENQKSFRPTGSAIRVNVYWFSGLVLSLSTVFVAILAKQWLYNLTIGLSPTRRIRARQRQFRHEGVEAWRLPVILSTLPIILHLSFLLFFAGLVDFLWQANSVVACVITVLVALTVTSYIASIVLSFIFVACPHKCSVVSISFGFLDTFGGEMYGSCVGMLVHTARYVAHGVTKLKGHISNREHTDSSNPNYVVVQSVPSSIWEVRKRLKKKWSTYISPQLAEWPRRQNRFINAVFRTNDTQALMWLIKQAPNLEVLGSLVKDLGQHPELEMWRAKLIDLGAGKILNEHLKTIYRARYHYLSPDERKSTLQYAGNLVRLLTEWSSDSVEATSTHIDGVPYCSARTGITGIRSLDHPDEDWKAVKDFRFFAIILRLQVSCIIQDWQGLPPQTRKSTRLFYARLNDPSTFITLLDDDGLKDVVNTAVYIALNTKPTQVMHESPAILSHTMTGFTRMTEVLPSMSSSVYRQIGYGIWLMSLWMTDRNSHGALPRLGNFTFILQVQNPSLSRVVGKALGDVFEEHDVASWTVAPVSEFSSCIITLIDSLLRQTSSKFSALPNTKDFSDRRDKEALLDGLVSRFHALLRHMRTYVTDHFSTSIRSPEPHRRMVRICRTIIREAAGRGKLPSYVEHFELMFDILLRLSQMYQGVWWDGYEHGREYRLRYHKLMWGSICELVAAWCGEEPSRSPKPVDLLTGDEIPLGKYALGVDFVVRAVGKSSLDSNCLPPSALEALLKIMLTMFQFYQDATIDNGYKPSDDLPRMRSLLCFHSDEITARLSALLRDAMLDKMSNVEVSEHVKTLVPELVSTVERMTATETSKAHLRNAVGWH